MTRRWPLCILALSAAATLSQPTQAQNQDFAAAVAALERGAEQEALDLLQKVLADDPSNETAFELWSNTENQVWLQLLTQGGELELVARELVERAKLGRKQRQNNPDAIRELVKQLVADDVIARTKVVNQLASEYGEFAVPIMVYALGEGADDDRRTKTIQAFARMGSDVVPPLVEAMEAPDAFLRRNVAITLGYLRDPRARPVLARAASQDPDSGVRTAAAKALESVGGGGDAGQLYLEQGEAYYREDDSVLAPHQYSDVVWSWEGTGLVATEVPRFLYAPEMAKKSYYRALQLLGDAGPALAGIGRCAVTEIGRLDEWMAAGQDVGDWEERLRSDELAAQLAGPEALDVALGWALSRRDMVAASGLCRLLADIGTAPTSNLQNALTVAQSGAVEGEAAVALGAIAYRRRAAASPATIETLTRYAGKEILRIGAVIGGDEASGRAMLRELGELGYHASWWSTGARGLVAMRSLPGVDLVIVDENPGDLTVRQVVNELRSDPRHSQTTIYVKTNRVADDDSLYGNVSGVISPGDGVAGAAEAAAAEPMNRDRQEALSLAARSAETLLMLAGGQSDVSSATETLADTLENRPDEVVVPALGVLRFLGGASHVSRVAGALSDDSRSEAVRVAAAEALAGIFARAGSADAGVMQSLQSIVEGDGPFRVRAATAGALGRLNLGKEARVELMRALRAR